MEQNNNDSLFDSKNLVVFLWAKRKQIGYTVLIAAIASIVFSSSFFISKPLSLPTLVISVMGRIIHILCKNAILRALAPLEAEDAKKREGLESYAS
jgi:hypothetical protein